MRSRFLAILPLFTVLSPARAGELETRTLQSEALGKEMKVNVLLPDGYAAAPDRRFPVIYLLHGYGGDYTEWQRVGVVEEAAGLLALVVMPEGDKSFYVNHHDDPKGKWEDYLTRDVVSFVDRTYRTQARREGRAISGLSMGGYGAMVLGLRHPELFGCAASHSGALGVPAPASPGEIDERLSRIFGPADSAERKVYDLKTLLREIPKESRPEIYLDCGSKDFLLEWNRSLVAELSKLGYGYEYREMPGGHSFDYWKRNVRYSMNYQLAALGRAPALARKPAPAPAAAEGGPSIVGDWDLVLELEGRKRDYTLRVTEVEKKLSAVLVSPRSGEHPFKLVSLKDGALRLEIDREYLGTPLTVVYEGKVAGPAISGTVMAVGYEQFKGTFTGKKKSRGQDL
jgi:S-formylglutathione hydrolase FrmB